MICAECGAAYRRQVWNIHGRKCPVWRCISRIDNGKRYCKKSPSIHEDKLHKAILTAINEYYDCKDSIKELLKSNVEQALLDINTKETKEIQQRLREIDEARNDYILLIASGAMDEESFDEQFQKLYDEERELNARLEQLKGKSTMNCQDGSRLDKALTEIDNNSYELCQYNDLLTRKIIECIKVVSKTEVQIVFKGGMQVSALVNK